MKKIILLLSLAIITSKTYSQATAATAKRFTFNNYINYIPPMGTPWEPGPDYGCLHPGLPSWFYFVVCGKNDTVVQSEVSISPMFTTVGLIIWGPFDDTTNIVSQLTAQNIDTCMSYAGSFVEFDHWQTGKIYYGMFSVDTNTSSFSMSQMWTGGYWFDDRCGICNGRAANYKQEMCMVTLDSATQKNMVIWEKKYPYQIASYNIYRETIIAGQWDSIGNVAANADGSYIDMVVNPFQRSYRYKVAGLDSCGETVLRYNNHSDSVSTPHATIHTQASPGFNGEVNLTWNPYEGFSYNTFYIYRGSTATTMQVLDSVAATTFSYTDFSPPVGTIYYKVTVKRAGGCSPDGGTTIFTQAISNAPYATIVGVDEIDQNYAFEIYPNPASNRFTISFSGNVENGFVSIYNSMGQKISAALFYGNDLTMNNNLPGGIYFVKLETGKETFTRKLIVE